MNAARRRWVFVAGAAVTAVLAGVTALSVMAYRQLHQEFGEYVLLSAGALMDIAAAVPDGDMSDDSPRMIAANALFRDVLILKLVTPDIPRLRGQSFACLHRIVGPEGRHLLASSQLAAGGVDLGPFLDTLAPAVIDVAGRRLASTNCAFVRPNHGAVSE